MGLIELIIVLAAIGFIVWLITTYVPMPDPFRKVIIVIVVIVLVLFHIRTFIGDIPLTGIRR